ncbi:MAG: multiheme c-type cytochrome [Planctomycetota bacterium]
MSTPRLAGLVLLGLLALALWLLSRAAPRTGSGSTTALDLPAVATAPALGGPQTCLPCHAAVVAEWQDSMHAQAFLDPQVRAPEQSDNFAKQDCLPCHASRSVFEFGIAENSRVMARVERLADGVDCLSCHGLPEGVAASRAGLTAACRPSFREELGTHQQCYACHNQHGTHDEWLASPAAAQGQDCHSCHMPRTSRSDTEAGAPRAGRSHRFLGGRDRDFALAGLELTQRVEAGEPRRLVVTLANRFAGHNLPTDTRNRAIDLVVRLEDALGADVPAPEGTAREPGCESGYQRLRLRNPYRSSGDPNTQLPAGESTTLLVPLPPAATRATIELLYKLTPILPDEQAHWRHTVVVDLH